MGDMNVADLQCYELVSEALPGLMCRTFPNGKFACLNNATTLAADTPNFNALGIDLNVNDSR